MIRVDTFYAHVLVYVYIFCTFYKCIHTNGFISNGIADASGMLSIKEASSDALKTEVRYDSTGEVDVRVYDSTGEVDVRVYDSTGEVDVRVYDSTGEVDVRVYDSTGEVYVRVYDSTGEVDVRVYDSIGEVDVRVCGVGALSLCIRESCNYML